MSPGNILDRKLTINSLDLISILVTGVLSDLRSILRSFYPSNCMLPISLQSFKKDGICFWKLCLLMVFYKAYSSINSRIYNLMFVKKRANIFSVYSYNF